MKRKFNKKEVKIYNKRFNELMNRIGAVQSKHWEYEYIVNTQYGKFSIFKDDLEDNIGVLAIHTRFHEPDKAKEYFNCNPHTGKWNFYESSIKNGLWQLHYMIFKALNNSDTIENCS